MKSLLKFLFGLIVVIAVLAIVGRIFLFEVAQTNSYSMVPNLIAGDTFLVKTVGVMGQGEIAVCENPEDPSSLVMLRIIGVPGDTVSFWKNHIKIDDDVIQHLTNDPITYEDNTSEETFQYDVRVAEEYFGGHHYSVALMDRGGGMSAKAVEVPEGYFFLAGDNRNMARDSRNFGLVPIESCRGRAYFLIWPAGDNGSLLFWDRILSWL